MQSDESAKQCHELFTRQLTVSRNSRLHSMKRVWIQWNESAFNETKMFVQNNCFVVVVQQRSQHVYLFMSREIFAEIRVCWRFLKTEPYPFCCLWLRLLFKWCWNGDVMMSGRDKMLALSDVTRDVTEECNEKCNRGCNQEWSNFSFSSHQLSFLHFFLILLLDVSFLIVSPRLIG